MDIFCTKCADKTKHEGAIQNGEMVFTCVCGHFVKFPAVKNKKELQTLIDEHEAINRPVAEDRKKALEQEKILADVLA